MRKTKYRTKQARLSSFLARGPLMLLSLLVIGTLATAAALLISTYNYDSQVNAASTSPQTAGSYSSNYLRLTFATSPTVSVTPTSSGATATADAGLYVQHSSNLYGYKLWLSMNGTSNTLTNTSNSSYTLPALTATRALNATASNNQWGYNRVSTVSNTNWKPVPVSTANSGLGDPIYPTATDTAFSTSTTTTNASVPLYFGANVTDTQASGNYQGTLRYTLTAGGSSSSTSTGVTVNKPSSDVDASNPGTMDVQITVPFYGLIDSIGDLTNAMTITGTTSVKCTPTVSGSSSSQSGTTLTATCTNVAMPKGTGGSNGTISLYIGKYNYTYTGTFKYYNPIPLFYSITYMQEMTSDVCNSVATPTTAPTQSATTYDVYKNGSFDAAGNITNYVPERILIDSRDQRGYKIRRLADGHCWMIGPLLLGSTSKGFTLYPSDTDFTSKSSFYLPPVLTTGAEASEWSNTEPRTFYEDGMYAFAYNFNAATAGQSATVTSGNTSESICPLNWTIFKERSTGEPSIESLLNAYGLSYRLGCCGLDGAPTEQENADFYTFRKDFPLEFDQKGWIFHNNLVPIISTRIWSASWSSFSSGQANYLLLDDGVIYLHQDPSTRGHSIRCVTK